MSRLGIIAGGGTLPQRLIDACRQSQRPCFVLGLKGQTQIPVDEWVSLGQTGRAISVLKAHGVDKVVLAGGVRHPWLLSLRPDWRTVRALFNLGRAALGDDRLLRAVAGELKKDGLSVVGAHEIDPSLLMLRGVLGKIVPDERQLADISRGIAAARELGRADRGQAAVVRAGEVVGVEDSRGTDALLGRVKGGGAVLVKACKPGQDRRFDLPAVGVRTVRRAHDAGLSGIAAEAGASLLIEREETIAEADRLGLFVYGFES